MAPSQPRIELISNVSGQLAGDGYGAARYWVEHVRQPVRFVDGVRSAESLGAEVFVEVGPGTGLAQRWNSRCRLSSGAAVATLTKEQPEAESLLGAAGRLFTTGVGVTWHWSAAFAGVGARRVELPTYGFARRRFWLGSGGKCPASGHESSRRAWPSNWKRCLATNSTVSWWNWCAFTLPPCWGMQAAVTSMSSVPSRTSVLSR